MQNDQTPEDVAAALDEQRARIDESNAKAMERMEKTQPTPTQREADLARLGALDLTAPKEEHGAEPETRALEAGEEGSYQTRAHRRRSRSE